MNTCPSCNLPFDQCLCTPKSSDREFRDKVIEASRRMMSGRHMPVEENEIERLMSKFTTAIKTVRSLAHPIAEASIADGKIHSVVGRQAFQTTAMRLFLDYFKDFDPDERLFLLAFVHANILTEQYV